MSGLAGTVDGLGFLRLSIPKEPGKSHRASLTTYSTHGSIDKPASPTGRYIDHPLD